MILLINYNSVYYLTKNNVYKDRDSLIIVNAWFIYSFKVDK